MNTSRSTYERDLPEDLLELIDHTTRGVQRLYESTRRAETPTAAGAKTPSTRRGTHAGFNARPNDLSQGIRLGAASRAVYVSKGKTESTDRITVTRDRDLPHLTNANGSNGLCQAAESDETNMSRRWSWSRTGVLPTGNVNNEPSGTCTINTTLSLDAQRRPPLALQSAAGYQGSASSTLNTSATCTEDHNSSYPGQRWKDTFKSLLSGAVAPNSSAIGTSAPEPATLSCAGTVAKEQGRATVIAHDSVEPQVSASTSVQLRSHSFNLAQVDAEVNRLQCKLEEQEVSHREAISRLRSEHSRQHAEFRRDALEARQKAVDDTSKQLMASFNVKQRLLQAEVDGERARADEMRQLAEERNKSIDTFHAELEASASRAQSLQSSLNAKESQVKELHELLESARRQNAALEEEMTKRLRDITQCKRREKLAVEHEQEMLNLVNRLESQLREQEQRSREELRRLEEEFHTTTKSYQELITEATDKLTVLEKMDRKYRTLKDHHRRQKQQEDELESRMRLMQEEKQQLTGRIEKLQEEVESLRLLVAKKEHELREERAGHHQVVEGITRRLEDQETKAAHGIEELQKAVCHAEECTARIRHEMEALSQQLQEEQVHSRELLVKLEQSSIQHHEELLSTRRAASAHQQQSESVIASLKRQLRDKDAKLEALATTASEPIQRLRRQLEDERGKRANLEEQFSRYKQEAKVAKEAALREIRREQERAASASRSQRRAVPVSSIPTTTRGDATAAPTPSPPSLATTTTNTNATTTATATATATNRLPSQRANGSSTPTDQRAPKTTASSLPHSYDRSRERSMMTPSRLTPTRTRWESVGSISNISCSSPFCSSRDGDVEDIEQRVVSADRHGSVVPDLEAHPIQSSQADKMDDRMVQHEQLLQEFHQSAAAVFRRITGNRDEFLARCTSVVRAVSHHTDDKGFSAAAGGAVCDELSD